MQQPLRLRPRDVPLQWDEAAAIVHVIADHVADGRLSEVPLVDWLALDEEGSLHVALPPNPEPGRSAASPASALRELFQELVDPNPVPAALLTAIQSADGNTRTASAEAFREAIRFFVRPAQEKAFRSVVARLRQHEEETQLQSGLDELTRKARSTEPPPGEAPSPDARATTSRARIRRKVLIAMFVCGVALLPLLLVLSGRWRGTAGLESPASTLINQGRELLKEGRATARSLLGGTAPADTTAAPTTPAPQPERGATRARERDPSGTPPVLRSEAVSEVASVSWILSHRVDALTDAPVVSPAGKDDPLYDSDDAEVTPASLLRPRLPSQPRADTPLAELGLLEVIIAANGQVERVRLLATTAERRYYDAMLLPAVKAWVFTPARRNGVPVRYRLEIPLTN